jgi:NAD+ synthase
MTDELLEKALEIDCALEVEKIAQGIRNILRKDIRKRGLVVAISGGVDSAVCAALSVKAVGTNKVFGLLLPERDSASESTLRGKQLADQLGIAYEMQDIAPTLEAIGCYRERDEAIRRLFPDYTDEWKNKIVIAGGLQGGVNHFKLVVQSPQGEQYESDLRINEYLQIVAATNYKQRVRKTVEYYHADRLNYAVIGTPNRLEYDQGFFVKNGDGSADIKPIAHLYKTQVYALARYLDLPKSICAAKPSTDTYSMSQGQDEFYFGLAYDKMDMALWAYNNNIPASQLADHLNVNEEMAGLIYKDIQGKRQTTRPLHLPPLLIEELEIN